ncbi:discoidin domain-containing protein [Lentzea sp. PSKA42]|uniref:Discoidin domain-containing protein n=1 Tax=Lentzea indica TaxID=2604800 RepID=A0ABX1FS85_9PSEU|nr:discoidin domain-containing protein [Lentzea indica]NKE61363.1 discoidin domain-containing protein [Lentzea indica]
MVGRRTALGALGLVLGLLAAGTISASAADPLVSGGKAVTASSIEGLGFEAAKAVDGSTSTRWASVEGHDPEWLRVDLGSTHTISRVKLNWEVAYAKTYRVQTSSDGSTWTDVYSTSAGDGGVDDLTVSGSGRYVRVYGTARGTTYGYSLWEFEVYGVGGGTNPPTTTTTTPPPVPGRRPAEVQARPPVGQQPRPAGR